MSNCYHSDYISCKAKLKEAAKQIAKLEKDNKRLHSTLELVKISMELSEKPFYEGMNILNEALTEGESGEET